MNKEYSKYFEIFHNEKNQYDSGKKKYKKCDGCETNKKITEKENELNFSCGSKDGDCGPQFKIHLPKYLDYHNEKKRLNHDIHGRVKYKVDYNKDDLSSYNIKAINKYMKSEEALKKQEDLIKDSEEKLDEINKKYKKENNLDEKFENIQEYYNNKRNEYINKLKLTRELRLKTTPDNRKHQIKKEYAKLTYESNKERSLLLEKITINKNMIKIQDENIEINNFQETKKKEKKEKKTKKDKKDKKDKEDKEDKEEKKKPDNLGDRQEMKLEAKKISKENEPIKYFSRSKNNKWLSAFNVGKEFEYDGYTYPSVENAFHAQKIDPKDPKEQEYKEKLSDKDLPPNEAKKFGGKKSFKSNGYKFRNDWDKIKLKLMKDISIEYYKVNPKYLKKLKETGENELIHTGPRIDKFWGVTKDGGENNHGKILMEIRKEF